MDGGAEFLGVGGLAQRLGLSRSRVRQLEELGVIPEGARLVPGDRRIWRLDDVDAIRERLNQRRAAGRRRGGQGATTVCPLHSQEAVPMAS